MAKKNTTVFVCNSCGYESGKLLGKCPACNEWNTFFEEKVQIKSGTSKIQKEVSKPVKLIEVEKKETSRIKTGIGELDRVLGGGFVNASLTLLGGEPGIGKSTLILQICDKIKIDGPILYVSGEESAEQIKLRADRLNIKNDKLMFLSETDIDNVENVIDNMKPAFLIIDSIQTMYSEEITSAAGSVSQVREITARVMKISKQKEITTIIIGHVTKDGNIAGPRVLEHMVDTVLYFEGERYNSYRLVRAVKNRFGSTNELGVFEMRDLGLVELENPSKILISEKPKDVAGSVIISTVEGTRPMLLEMQALVSPTSYGIPKRTATGVDYNRVGMLLAVLEKRVGLQIQNQDVYLNIVGGIKINEPSIDLGIVMAIVSSFRNIAIDETVAVTGEVGLTGEVRAVSFIEKRIAECKKLGFTKMIIPRNNYDAVKDTKGIEIWPVDNLRQAINIVVGGNRQ